MRVEERVSNIIDAQKNEANYSITEAKKAIARAKTAQADKYSPDLLKEAEDSLEIAQISQSSGGYTKCLVTAIKAKEKAESAELQAKQKTKFYKTNLLGETFRALSLWGH